MMIIFKSKFIKEMKTKYAIDIVVDINYPNVYMVYFPTYKGSEEYGQKRIEGFDEVEKFCKQLQKIYE